MHFQNNSKGVDSTLANGCYAELKQLQCSKALLALQEIRDIAWHKAVKYRFDPVLGRMHEEYLNSLNEMIKEICA